MPGRIVVGDRGAGRSSSPNAAHAQPQQNADPTGSSMPGRSRLPVVGALRRDMSSPALVWERRQPPDELGVELPGRHVAEIGARLDQRASQHQGQRRRRVGVLAEELPAPRRAWPRQPAAKANPAFRHRLVRTHDATRPPWRVTRACC